MNPPLQKLWDELADWQEKNFPKATQRSMIAHLRRELKELEKDPSDAMELADCFILLLGIARKGNYSAHAFIENGLTKLEICKARKWGQPDKHGVYEHVREEATCKH